MIRKHDLGWLAVIMFVLVMCCASFAEACETELPEETNIELGFYP